MSRLMVDFIIIVIFTIILVIGYCCLAMASKWDDISEEQWKQYQAEHGDEEDSL